MKNYKGYFPFVVITLFFIVVYYNCFDAKLDLNGDNATYIRLARNIAEGLGYSNISHEGVAPASHFPPGYSAFLSLFVTLGLDNLILFKILNGVLLLFSIFMLYMLSCRLSGNKALALTASILICFSPHLMHFASMAMSEMLYLMLTVLAFVALYRYTASKHLFYKSPWFYVALLSAVASYHVRTVGASIIFAVLLFFLFRKEWKASLASLFGMVLLLLPWMVRNAVHGIESRYFGTIMTVNPWRPELGTVSSVGEMFSKMITNIDETVIKGFREILFPFLDINYQEPSGAMGIVAGLLVACVVLYGCWSLGGRNFRFPFLAFILANIGLFALWHGGNGSRYVVPIAPYLFFFFYFGLYNIVILALQKVLKLSVNESKMKWQPYLLLLLLLPMVAPVKEQSAIAAQPFPPAYKHYFKLAETIEQQLPAGSVVSCRKPELFDYYAPSHYASRYPFTNDSEKMLSGLLAGNVDFVILEQLGYSSTVLYLLPVVQNHPDLFRVVAHIPNPDTYLLYFDKVKAKEFLQKK